MSNAIVGAAFFSCKNIKRKIVLARIKMICLFFKTFAFLFPIRESQFFCMSMLGRSMGCNIEPLAKYISAQEEKNVVIWAFDKVVFDVYCHKVHHSVKVGTFAYYKALFCSRYLIVNQRMTDYHCPMKRNGQIYLQTWHGTALKRIENDIPGVDEKYKKRAERDSSMIDVFISGSAFMSNLYKQSFWYSGPVFETGSPRNDIFFDKDDCVNLKVRSALGVKREERIVLYAPTFRQSVDSFLAYDVDSILFRRCLEKKFGGSWRFLVRLHPNLINEENATRIRRMYPEAIDVSRYPDMQELLFAADVLVTDYSSSMFDYMYTGRPCFLYVKDYACYDRGFYFNFSELPFPVIERNSMIEPIVCGFDKEEYDCKVKSFFDRIGSVETGVASKRCYELLVGRA